MPIITNALANKTRQTGGQSGGIASLLEMFLNKGNASQRGGGIVDLIGTLIGGQNSSGAGGILDTLFGPQKSQVNEFIGRNSGVSSDKSSQIMEMLLPVVMNVLSGQQQQRSQSQGFNIADFLQQSQEDVRRTDPRNSNMIDRLLNVEDNQSQLLQEVAKSGVDQFLKSWMSGRLN